MSDFFQQLVDRSASASGAVRPRVASMFEPTSESATDGAPSTETGVRDEHEAPATMRSFQLGEHPAAPAARPSEARPRDSAHAWLAPRPSASSDVAPDDASAPSHRSAGFAPSVADFGLNVAGELEAPPALLHAIGAPLAPSRGAVSRERKPRRADASAPLEVRVTIGRIEVRAVHPPPAVAPQPREQGNGLLTLEEYMTRRREGRS